MTESGPQGAHSLTPRKSRRTVVKAAVWSAPAIAVISAAPAFASTPLPPTGADISTPNFGADRRGFRVFSTDSNFNNTAFANGTVITLTITGNGTLNGLTITGGAFSPAITTLAAGNYIITATTGAMGVTIAGTMTPNPGGSLTATGSMSWVGPPSGSAPLGSATTASVP